METENKDIETKNKEKEIELLLEGIEKKTLYGAIAQSFACFGTTFDALSIAQRALMEKINNEECKTKKDLYMVELKTTMKFHQVIAISMSPLFNVMRKTNPEFIELIDLLESLNEITRSETDVTEKDIETIINTVKGIK